ncbi:MAG: cytochrome b [Sphingobium sp.]|nr:cytochrome b [Sphingobium sp.]
MPINDTPIRYGSVSRFLHWGMALLFLWQFTGMILKETIGRTPVTGIFVGSHSSVGMLLLALLILRAIWAFVEFGHRPPYHGGIIGKLAAIGHVALYGLMLIVPSIALMRAFGGDKGVKFFGLILKQPGGEKVEWMMAPANLAHGNLGWILLLLIIGHVVMVFVHRWLWKDDVLSRMIGSSPR